MENHTLFIHSSSRINGDINNATYLLDPQIFNFEQKYKLHFHILQFSIKNSYYYINSTNNSFTYSEGVTDYSLTITPGTYSAQELASEIQLSLNSSGGSIVWTITYLPSKNKFRFVKTTNDADVTFTFPSSGFTHKVFGFDLSSKDMNTGTTTMDSDNLIWIGNILNVNIHVDKSNISEELHQDRGEHKTTLVLSVPVLSPRFGNIVFQDESTHNYEFICNPFSSPSMTIQLKDDNGTLIPFTDDYRIVFRLIYEPIEKQSMNELMRQLLIVMAS